MSEKRRGLGRGLGALIPSAPPAKPAGDRPVDVFFNDRPESEDGASPATAGTPATADTASTGATPQSAGASGTAATSGATESAATGSGGDAPESGKPGGSGIDAVGDRSGAHVGQAADSDLIPVPGATFAELPVTAIVANRKQPRQVFDEEALAELVHSVREIGVLQPIVVRPLSRAERPEVDRVITLDGSVDGAGADSVSVSAATNTATNAPRYELIMGERRWRAVQAAGLETIPAIVRSTSDDDLLRDALLENLHRADLNPLEEAAAYQQLLDDFGCTHEELATRIGRSRPQISNTIRLLRLPPLVQRRVAAGVLSAGHARALLGLDDTNAMERLAARIVAEGLSVRATEEAVSLSDGDSPAPAPRRRPRAGRNHAELDDLAGRLADRLDTRVNISLGRNKGKISVEFASVEDLNRILALLAPDERKAFQPQD